MLIRLVGYWMPRRDQRRPKTIKRVTKSMWSEITLLVGSTSAYLPPFRYKKCSQGTRKINNLILMEMFIFVVHCLHLASSPLPTVPHSDPRWMKEKPAITITLKRLFDRIWSRLEEEEDYFKSIIYFVGENSLIHLVWQRMVLCWIVKISLRDS